MKQPRKYKVAVGGCRKGVPERPVMPSQGAPSPFNRRAPAQGARTQPPEPAERAGAEGTGLPVVD
eukprot:6376292-Lingulodinium_polyedra.AAC.1